MQSINGIFYDLKDSTYTFSYEQFTFYFSSKIYLKKFSLKFLEFAENENIKLCSKYRQYIDMKIYFIILYYARVEKRGFRIVDEFLKEELPKNLIFKAQLSL